MSVVDLGLIVAAAQATLDEATLVRDIAALGSVRRCAAGRVLCISCVR